MGETRLLGRYEILNEIGRGGMAVVYLGRHLELDRLVAVKELRALSSEDPALVERFVREARVASALSHPNVVTVYDFFQVDGLPYIAMEYVDGGSLRQYIGQLSMAQIGGVLEAVLAGLAHAERHGIVHRDLKPENLLITSEGRLKIADFGIAKAMNQTTIGRSLTATGMTVGTPEYMAPEQATAGEIGPRTDLYSLGVIAYELVTGTVPFVNTDTPMAVLFSHVWDPVRDPKERCPDLDDELAAWVMHLLAKEPADRPAGAGEAWETLEPILVRMEGPLWRQSARLPAARSAGTSSQTSLTPARFPTSQLVGTTAGATDAGYVTYREPLLTVTPTAEPVATTATGVTSGPVTPPPRPTVARPLQSSEPQSVLPTVTTVPPATPSPPPPPPPAPPDSGPPPPRRRRLLIAGAAALVLLIIGAVAAGLLGGGSKSEPTRTAAPKPPRELTVPQIIAKARPAVLQLRGRWGSQRYKATGIVIDAKKGYVLTAAHFSSGLESIQADFNSKETVPARIVEQSPCEDIALLQLTRIPAGLTALKLGDARSAAPGSVAVAVGYPASLQRESSKAVAVGTSGTIAANDIHSIVPDRTLPRLEWVVQTTAAINPGNSGGPLLDSHANVIGMLTLSNGEVDGQTAQGENYAIAANVLANALPKLQSGEAVNWGWNIIPARGLPVANWLIDAFRPDINPAWARDIQRWVNSVGGMYVVDVDTGSAADRAHLQPGDMVRTLNGTPVKSMAQTCDVMVGKAPGDVVKVRGTHLDVESWSKAGYDFGYRLKVPE